MKFSIFNNRIPLSNNTDILFNSLSEESRIIPKNMILDVKTMTPEIITEFVNAGFIIDDNIIEEKIVRESFDKNQNSKHFKLTINPTLNCNFRCWYCYESHHAQSTMSAEILEKVKNSISFISNNYDSIELAFFGGEPLMYFDQLVLPLIEWTAKKFSLKGRSYEVTFTTNGYLINERIIKSLQPYNIGISQITLDGGREFHNKTRVSNKTDSFCTIVDNMRTMASVGMPVLLRINVTKENINSAYSIPEYINSFSDTEKSKVKVLIQQVWQDSQNDILDEIWGLYGEFLKIGIIPWPRRFNFYKHICYADIKNSAVINYNGKIFKCTAIDFDKKEADGEVESDGTFDISIPYKVRLSKRLANRLCPECRIYPVCNGGCSKNIDQAQTRDFCLHPSNAAKDKVVRNILREQLHMANIGISWKD
jgi:uncharacterized protein